MMKASGMNSAINIALPQAIYQHIISMSSSLSRECSISFSIPQIDPCRMDYIMIFMITIPKPIAAKY